MSKHAKIARRNEALAQSVLKRMVNGEEPQDALAKSLVSCGMTSKSSYKYYQKILNREFCMNIPSRPRGRPRGLKDPKWCLNIDRDQAIVLAYKSGIAAMSKLARDYNLTGTRVQQIVSRAGVNGREIRKNRIDVRLKKDVQAGMRVALIAQKHGVTQGAVRKAYRVLGLQLPAILAAAQHAARRKAMIAAYQAGEPAEKIASEFGIRVSSLRTRLSKWKVRRAMLK